MAQTPEELDELLLDWHLDRLEPAEADRLEAALAASSEWQTRSDSLGRLLGILDQAEVPPPATDLVESVMSAIANQDSTTLRLPPAGPTLSPSPVGESRAGRMFFSLRDLVAVAACVVLFVGLAVPGYFRAHAVSQRSVCQNNLRTISEATDAYAEAQAGFLPFADYVPGGSWLAGDPRHLPPASNTRHVFRLVRRGHIPNIRVFVCPAAKNGRPMLANDYRLFNDFAEPANNSYSFVFMNHPQGKRVEDLAGTASGPMVFAADRNPHFHQEGKSSLQTAAYLVGNSLLHENGAGQNVIHIDGSSGWFTSPNVGVDGDNIYRAGDLTQYQGTEQPLYETDTFLP